MSACPAPAPQLLLPPAASRGAQRCAARPPRAGVALLTKSGSFHSGCAIESCAYNPSLPPLQTALVSAVADGVGAWWVPCAQPRCTVCSAHEDDEPQRTLRRDEIVEAVLFERPGAAVSQEAVTRLALSCIAPAARLTVLHVEDVLPPGERGAA